MAGFMSDLRLLPTTHVRCTDTRKRLAKVCKRDGDLSSEMHTSSKIGPTPRPSEKAIIETEKFDPSPDQPTPQQSQEAATNLDTYVEEVSNATGKAPETIRAEHEAILPKATFGRKGVRSETIEALLKDSEENREAHHRQAESGEYKKSPPNPDSPNSFWRQQAETPLFRSKRSAALADLLTLNTVLCRYLSEQPTVEDVKALLANSTGRQAVVRIARIAKGDTVGTAIADLTVCGAIPPYNSLLGGKLVAMLAVSPAVVAEYARRYHGKSSIIASSMAGRKVIRRAHLVFVGTTSLYGVRPSQYDRISIPCEILGGTPSASLRYDFIERTVGWGTFQFGKSTKASIEQYVVSQKSGWRVNNVFGEGANPRMRALREGLGKLGLDEEELLHHGLQKSMYGVKLASNTTDYLLGLDDAPIYLFSTANPEMATSAIALHWAKRWMLPRLERPEVLDQIRRHTLVYPITHGARVVLPDRDVDQGLIF